MRVVSSNYRRVMPSVPLLVCAAIAVTACQSGDTVSRSPVTAQPPSATPTPAFSPSTAKDAVLAVYRELYRAGQRAEHAPPDERRTILEQVATPPLLDTMVKGIAALRAKGRVTWGYPIQHPFDIHILGDRADLHDCQDARQAGQADDRTGKRLTHGISGTHLVVALSKETDDVWRVVKVIQLEEPCSPTP